MRRFLLAVKRGVMPRLISREAAAKYCGLSPNSFEARVLDGTFPLPLHMGRRRLWDLKALNMKLDYLSGIEPSLVSDEPDYDAMVEAAINGLGENEVRR